MKERPIVIAHRGASGYLPEHTLAAKALAYGMGADFLEQDLVLTADDVPVVLHDIYLDTVTDVAVRYPGRARADGRFYALDFTLEEIRTLRVHERTHPHSQQSVFPRRFPVGKSRFFIPTFAEEIELVQGLNQSTGGNVGIYPEIKAPAWHWTEGRDLVRAALAVLDRYGYRGRESNIYLQCFDPAETKRLRNDLQCDLKLIQLIAENAWKEADADFDALVTPAGLAEIATYADGIGVSLSRIIHQEPDGSPSLTSLVADAHAAGLKVHPYTLRADQLPAGVGSFEQLHSLLFEEAHVDGVFTDFTDVTVRCLEGH